MSPSRHSRRNGLRVPTRDTALPGLRARQPSAPHTARRQLPRRHASSREVNRKKSQARRSRSSPSTSSLHSPTRTRNASWLRLGVVDAALAGLEDPQVDPELRELDRRLAVLVGEPTRRTPRLGREPLGIAHVDDEPTLRHRGKPGASVLKPRFVHGNRFSQPKRRLSRMAERRLARTTAIAPARVVAWVEVEDDGLAAELRQRYLLALVALEREVRCRLSLLEHAASVAF